LREAQKAYGLSVTGKATAETLARLRAEFAKRLGNSANGGDNSINNMSYASDTKSPAVADAIASRNPCRIIALCPVAGEDEGVTAQVSAYCPIQKQSSTTLVCCEYVTLRGTVAALERVGGIIPALLIGGLPKFLWWKATPDPNHSLFKRLAVVCNSVILDSSDFTETEADLLKLQELLEMGTPIADLNCVACLPGRS
jgi:glucose-6-phosphate dehydrogenase assembly protein OpcA